MDPTPIPTSDTPRKATTIKDVARRARCSIASVSRVVNDSGPVSGALRLRIAAAVAELEFRPSEVGRSLVLKRSRTIGVLVPSVTNPVFADCLAGLQETARRGGHAVLIAQSNYEAGREVEAIEPLIAERPAGLVLTVCDPASSEARARAAAAGIPTVLLFNEASDPGVALVTVDNRGAGRDLAAALIGRGHRRIAFVAGRFAASDRARARYEGVRDALVAAGLPVEPPVEADFIDGPDRIDLADILDRLRPTAIVASNDLLAIGVVAALRRHGLAVPDDVSVAGFDGIAIGGLIAPSLATIAWPARAMGTTAAAMLLDLVAGRGREPGRTLTLPHLFRPGGTLADAPNTSR
ncbi:LacI family DNA-binding transcriptional regulator [Rhodoplanes sp. TEM]|uniref:LacI family DNA-binding transcriptional regulator n=1 Tax=Rhodoplanes tepidamans TaxID=200616 RepID=A0ABT5J4U3_RHOTP|nr:MULTISPECIES: LacI family DNA-binding transcriptional regulator [Rhodoplanes]MDC7784663.1 LacI family DNA-binding transcriptional regulator [Rhodoplanes tepidamans]MDC7982130.1 LacI family DNA-binding transcriptional regulator [Rhodoplanes sp. TEM]MDQ0356132.1 DNA-binding LacI/PurR family transcriptional regulator [Rhodoplanes tepidamans]